jgi:hypothetical protein
VVDVVAVGRDLARVRQLLEQVGDGRGIGLARLAAGGRWKRSGHVASPLISACPETA